MKGDENMKEILQSKVMIAFIIFVLGFTYFGADLMQEKNDSELSGNTSQIENLNK